MIVCVLALHRCVSSACCKQSEKLADVRYNSYGLACSPIAHLGGDCGINVDADDFYPAWKHVASGDGM